MAENISEAMTKGVRITVRSQYIPEKSDPSQYEYFFAYTVTIINEGTVGVQLLSRHWIITNEAGYAEEVRGPGVVGQQPALEPGGSFEYTSFCPLNTPTGTMKGSYQMVTDTGEEFDAEIAPFLLSRDEIVYH